MTPNRHRIQRQILELTVGDASVAPAIQEQLARTCREPLLNAMTAMFDQAAPAHQLLRLERLEIDVGRIEGGDWAPEFGRRVLAELARQLEGEGAGQSRAARTDAAEAGGSEFDVFVFFLRHGRLPWWGNAPAGGWSASFDALDARCVAKLRPLLREDPRALTRIVAALPDDRLDALMAGFSPLRDCAEVLRVMRPTESAALNHHWRRRFWNLTLAWAAAAGGPGNATALVHALLNERCALAMAQLRQGEPASQRAGFTATAPSIRPLSFDALPAPWREWCAAACQETVVTPPVAQARAAKASDGGAAPALVPRRPAPATDGADTIYLPCAGVLLLHPFLETLFRERGLLAGAAFADEPSRVHAVQLLGYLATGRADAPEYELGFAKLLVGMELGAPVDAGWLDEADITACDQMLTAVLRHWTALRSGSAAWLRSQFFLRDGKLETVDGGQRITVERRAQDVLLAKLPWGFGVIKLPWLGERIFVRWLD